jgi:ACR3 family arsenite transporter
MGLFERYLSLWVALSIGLGVILGLITSDVFAVIAGLEYAHVNIVVATYLADDLPNDDSSRFYLAKRCR